MKITKDVHTLVQITEKIICDCCKKEYDDPMEIQEFISIDREFGYGSIFGDGNTIELDLCQYCFKKLVGKFAIIK